MWQTSTWWDSFQGENLLSALIREWDSVISFISTKESGFIHLTENEELSTEIMSSTSGSSMSEGMDLIYTLSGQYVSIHPQKQCEGWPCPFHNPSDHHMIEWPQHFRSDRGITERLCEHGVGHPDPDDIKVRTIEAEGVHGCDGCCASPGDGD